MKTRDLLVVAAIVGLPLAAYFVSAGIIAAADGRTVASVDCFDAERAAEMSAARLLAAAVMATGAAAFLFASPWLLGLVAFLSVPRTRTSAHMWSLTVGSAGLIAVCSGLRLTVGISRDTFLAAWLIWTICLAAAAMTIGDPCFEIGRLWRRYGNGLLMSMAIVAAGILVFHKEHFIQCFDGDGAELYQLAHSLRDHFLPYANFEESDGFGTYIVAPAVINSYWTLGLQVLLGTGELATRLSYWVYWLAILAVLFRMADLKSPLQFWGAAVAMALLVLLFTGWATWYVGYSYYMADVANPGVPDALFTLFFLLSLDCLRCRDATGGMISLVMASLVVYAGPVMIVLLGAAALLWRPVDRKQLLRAGQVGGLLLVGITTFYLVSGFLEGSLSAWWAMLQQEYVSDYVESTSRWATAWRYGLFFVLGCGGIPAAALVFAFARNGWERTIATATLAYLMIVLAAGEKNLHYLLPLLPIPLLLWLRMFVDDRSRFGLMAPWLAAASLLGCLLISWPAARPIFVLNRQLGAGTSFQAFRYEVAWADSKVAFDLYDRGVTSWFVDPQSWLVYSDVQTTPLPQRPLFLGSREAPSPEYRRIEGTGRIDIYCNDETFLNWMATQQPVLDQERFPRVFSSIVKTPRPRVPADEE